MFKIKRLLKGLLKSNPYLTPVINRSRVYNAYMSVADIGMIVFQLSITGRTNQSNLVLHYII